MTTDEYLAAIHLALIDSPVVATFTIVRQRITSQTGHLRVRIKLTNDDFLEAAEFFRLTPDGITVADYRHQWMDGNRTVLRKRWDSTPHHPQVDNFPHHCHEGSEERVMPGVPLSIQEVLSTVSQEIAAQQIRDNEGN